MKDECDFSNTEQDKLCVPVEDIQVLVPLNKEVLRYFTETCQIRPENLGVWVNYLLSRDIEIARRMDL